MALETVAVETFALRAISRISIGLGSRGLLLPQSYHDADRLKLENVFQTPTLGCNLNSLECQALSKVSCAVRKQRAFIRILGRTLR